MSREPSLGQPTQSGRLRNVANQDGASHEAAARPTPEDLYGELAFDPVAGRVEEPPGLIMLFDDMLTTGAHFVAATRRLGEVFPGVRVIGSFIARRVVPNPFADFEDLTAL